MPQMTPQAPSGPLRAHHTVAPCQAPWLSPSFPSQQQHRHCCRQLSRTLFRYIYITRALLMHSLYVLLASVFPTHQAPFPQLVTSQCSYLPLHASSPKLILMVSTLTVPQPVQYQRPFGNPGLPKGVSPGSAHSPAPREPFLHVRTNTNENMILSNQMILLNITSGRMSCSRGS
jgi:hypothetical protein